MHVHTSGGWLLGGLALALITGQTPPRDVPPRTGTAVISGRVLAADTGAPQPDATVWVAGTRTGESERVVTDAQGRFLLENLRAGKHLVHVTPSRERSGYLGTSRRSGGPRGPIVELQDGQALEGLTVELEAGGRVTGRVVDERGDPISRVNVHLLAAVGVDVARVGLVATGTTNDRGEFRLVDLQAGDYVVRTMGIAPNPRNRDARTYLPTFHPGTPDRSAATVVTVGGGDERSGVDIQLVPGRYLSVSGQLVGFEQYPPNSSRVVASIIEEGYFTASTPRPYEPDGSFRITLPPGEYVVTGWTRGETASDVVAASDPAKIVLSDSDVDGLVLRLSPGVTVAGRLSTEGHSDPPFLSQDVEVVGLPAGAGQALQTLRRQARVREDGTFELRGVQGPTYVRLASEPAEGWALTAVRLDGRDISEWSLDRPTTADELELVIGNRGARITGRVVGADGLPAIRRPVIAFPAEPGLRSVMSPRFRRVTSDEDGLYEMSALQPGDYFVVALDAPFQADRIADGRPVERLVPLARRITLKPNETATMNLKLGGGPRED